MNRSRQIKVREERKPRQNKGQKDSEEKEEEKKRKEEERKTGGATGTHCYPSNTRWYKAAAKQLICWWCTVFSAASQPPPVAACWSDTAECSRLIACRFLPAHNPPLYSRFSSLPVLLWPPFSLQRPGIGTLHAIEVPVFSVVRQTKVFPFSPRSALHLFLGTRVASCTRATFLYPSLPWDSCPDQCHLFRTPLSRSTRATNLRNLYCYFLST